MRAIEFLTEDEKEISVVSASDIQAIRANCGDYLGNATRPLLRGMVRGFNGVDELQQRQIRSNRQNKDSSSLPVALFNYAFEEKFGIARIRAISAFASSDYRTALEYGAVGLMFPFNGTHYAFSDTVDDLYDVLKRYARDDLNLVQLAMLPVDDTYTKSEIDDSLVHADEQTQTEWKMAIASVKSIVRSYEISQGYDRVLSSTYSEIMMFGVPSYYILPLRPITNLAYASHNFYADGKPINLSGGPEIISTQIFNLIKAGVSQITIRPVG